MTAFTVLWNPLAHFEIEAKKEVFKNIKILANIKKDFKDEMDCIILLLCKISMHSHLEYCAVLASWPEGGWSITSEGTERRATKGIKWMKQTDEGLTKIQASSVWSKGWGVTKQYTVTKATLKGYWKRSSISNCKNWRTLDKNGSR